jgi:hypothetical protein
VLVLHTAMLHSDGITLTEDLIVLTRRTVDTMRLRNR